MKEQSRNLQLSYIALIQTIYNIVYKDVKLLCDQIAVLFDFMAMQQKEMRKYLF